MNNAKKTKTTNNQVSAKTLRNRRKRQRRRAINRAEKKIEAGNQSSSSILSKCAFSYARAIVNPFGSYQELPCIPDTIPTPSNKIVTKTRGTFSTGVQGIGWVVYDPFAACVSNGGLGTTVSSFPILHTTEEFDDNEYTWGVSGSTLTTGVVGANSNSPYTQNDYQTRFWRLRLVAGGIRVRYIGSNFRNQGRLVIYRQPASSNIPVSDSADLMQDNFTVALPVARKSEYVFYTPTVNDLLSYQPYEIFNPGFIPEGGQNHYCLLIYVEGGDTEVPQSWEFEAVSYYEIQGSHLSLSPSHSDPQGMGRVLSSLPVKAPEKPPETILNSVMKRIASYAFEQGSYALNRYMNPIPRLTMGNYSIEELDD